MTQPPNRPPDEYFATPGPDPLRLPEGYVDDRPPELVKLVDELASLVTEAMVADTLATILRLGRRAMASPPPEWPPLVHHAHTPPSAVELADYVSFLIDRILAAQLVDPDLLLSYTVANDLGRAFKAVDDVQWLLACASHRWLNERNPAHDFPDHWWRVNQWRAAMRYTFGTLGSALAVRDEGMMA